LHCFLFTETLRQAQQLGLVSHPYKSNLTPSASPRQLLNEQEDQSHADNQTAAAQIAVDTHMNASPTFKPNELQYLKDMPLQMNDNFMTQPVQSDLDNHQ
jgi:hypothetical protein